MNFSSLGLNMPDNITLKNRIKNLFEVFYDCIEANEFTSNFRHFNFLPECEVQEVRHACCVNILFQLLRHQENKSSCILLSNEWLEDCGDVNRLVTIQSFTYMLLLTAATEKKRIFGRKRRNKARKPQNQT
ncbi:CLUMA_CG018328, isoform A [Clunio marinus]|uniref:CLUMA_CG018328, isoform A n=1 Tax=Clunio marinus TaxID=568069 RepID=A0A1J1J2F1_9DIPT|nr:CLUMA_CG018328, isoform A [Clunio marinus]